MRKCIIRISALILAAVMMLSVGITAVVYADYVDEEVAGYLVLGADLTESQTETVLDYLGVEDINNYAVSYTTNEDEHEAFDAYLSSSIIGTKAYSSILLIPGEEESGITITSTNISYVTTAMYQNALITAGVSDVEVRVAAPFSVSGTSALVGAMNAYTIMTGEEISEETADAAVDELVTTGEVGEAIGDNDAAAELVAVLKQQVAESDEELSEEELEETVDTVCIQLEITLDDELKQELIAVLQKLQETDSLDASALETQASDLYDSISDTLEELGESGSTSISSFFQRIGDAIVGFFQSIGPFFASLGSSEESESSGANADSSTEASSSISAETGTDASSSSYITPEVVESEEPDESSSVVPESSSVVSEESVNSETSESEAETDSTLSYIGAE